MQGKARQGNATQQSEKGPFLSTLSKQREPTFDVKPLKPSQAKPNTKPSQAKPSRAKPSERQGKARQGLEGKESKRARQGIEGNDRQDADGQPLYRMGVY